MTVQLHVTCVRNGRVQDGGIHATYANMAEAQANAPGELRWLSQFYDRVQHQLVEVPDKIEDDDV